MDQTSNFYYDGDEIQDYNKEAKERQHLKNAAIIVNEWIQHLQQQPTRPSRPVLGLVCYEDLLEANVVADDDVTVELMAATAADSPC